MNQPSRTLPPCPHCQGRRVWAEARTGENNSLRLIYGHTPGRFIRASITMKAVATICLNCGLIEFYTNDVQKMQNEFQQHPEWFDL